MLLQNSELFLDFQRLYELGMRRLFFVGAAPIGCLPLMRELNLLTQECHPGANDLSVRYNAEVASLLRSMSARHPDFRYSFFDGYTALMQYIDKPQANGTHAGQPMIDANMLQCSIDFMNTMSNTSFLLILAW